MESFVLLLPWYNKVLYDISIDLGSMKLKEMFDEVTKKCITKSWVFAVIHLWKICYFKNVFIVLGENYSLYDANVAVMSMHILWDTRHSIETIAHELNPA